jgi:hypothetical protein
METARKMYEVTPARKSGARHNADDLASVKKAHAALTAALEAFRAGDAAKNVSDAIATHKALGAALAAAQEATTALLPAEEAELATKAYWERNPPPVTAAQAEHALAVIRGEAQPIATGAPPRKLSHYEEVAKLVHVDADATLKRHAKMMEAVPNRAKPFGDR